MQGAESWKVGTFVAPSRASLRHEELAGVAGGLIDDGRLLITPRTERKLRHVEARDKPPREWNRVRREVTPQIMQLKVRTDTGIGGRLAVYQFLLTFDIDSRL